jgi:hypothetical protein
MWTGRGDTPWSGAKGVAGCAAQAKIKPSGAAPDEISS